MNKSEKDWIKGQIKHLEEACKHYPKDQPGWIHLAISNLRYMIKNPKNFKVKS